MNRLPEEAFGAWQAFNAMTATKQRHIDYLKDLEARYRKYGSPNEDESAVLSRLLAEHDQQVTAFLEAMNALRRADEKAHGELIGYITRLNEMPIPGHQDDHPAATH